MTKLQRDIRGLELDRKATVLGHAVTLLNYLTPILASKADESSSYNNETVREALPDEVRSKVDAAVRSAAHFCTFFFNEMTE